jgi:phage baseplate assembly protein W
MAYIRSNRVDPRDFQINTAIGVALPFNAGGVFTSVYSTKDQLKFNLINLVLTSQGERIENPEFGTTLKQQLFNQITEDTVPLIKNSITTSVAQFIPEIAIEQVDVIPYADDNTLVVTIKYRILLSGQTDSVTVNFV